MKVQELYNAQQTARHQDSTTAAWRVCRIYFEVCFVRVREVVRYSWVIASVPNSNDVMLCKEQTRAILQPVRWQAIGVPAAH